VTREEILDRLNELDSRARLGDPADDLVEEVRQELEHFRGQQLSDTKVFAAVLTRGVLRVLLKVWEPTKGAGR
jgi:hypothetical protein